MGRADLHIHTSYSDGMASVHQVLDYVEHRTDLDVVAITDHDQIRGALEAVDRIAARPSSRLQVVVGTEISTLWGRHLLAYFFAPPYPTQPFPRFRPLGYTVQLVQEWDGIVIVPHPLCHWTPSVGKRTLTRLLRRGVPVAGVEVCNASIAVRGLEPRIRRANRAYWRLPELGSSDAHHLVHIGGAYTEFPGSTAHDLARALADGQTTAHWGDAGSVGVRGHARQMFRALVTKPLRELRAVFMPYVYLDD